MSQPQSTGNDKTARYSPHLGGDLLGPKAPRDDECFGSGGGRPDVSHMPRLEPEKVAQASMLALDGGEIVYIPTLEDADLLKHHDQADIEILMRELRPELALRYHDAPGRQGNETG